MLDAQAFEGQRISLRGSYPTSTDYNISMQSLETYRQFRGPQPEGQAWSTMMLSRVLVTAPLVGRSPFSVEGLEGPHSTR